MAGPHIYSPGDRVIVEDVTFPGDGTRWPGVIVRATGAAEDYGDGATVAMYEVLLDGMDAAGKGVYVPATSMAPA